VGQLVEDYYIDFHVVNRDESLNQHLTVRFEEDFKTQVTHHTTTKSHRVFMMSCQKLGEFYRGLLREDARLILEVTGVSPLPDVRYDTSRFVAFDPAVPLGENEPALLEPNSTTLVNVILNRTQTDRLATITDGRPVADPGERTPATKTETTGRAALVEASRS
jgi:hypothetical protein